jgi:hypothetical protein
LSTSSWLISVQAHLSLGWYACNYMPQDPNQLK